MDDFPAPPSLLEAAARWHVRVREGGAEVDEAFARWLGASPGHRLAYADVCMADLAMQEFAAQMAAEDVQLRSSNTPTISLPTHMTPRRATRPTWISRGFALAASLFVLVGGVSTVWLQQARWQDWTSDASTGTAEVRELALDDGSILWLAPDSAVDIHIDASTRRIDVRRGEVFAQVARDASRPFDVVAGDVVARAVGTRYSVAKVLDAVDVAVEEGRVAVRRSDAAESIELVAGQSVQLRHALHPLPGTLDAGQFAWRDGLLVLENAPLDDALARLDAYLPQRIVHLPRNTDDERRITAAIPAGDAAAALDAIVADHGLTRHDLAGVVIVIR